MLAVDTNVVIRFLVNDDAAQYQRTVALFRSRRIWISRTVLLESEWVLRKVYGFEQEAIADAFSALISLPNVDCDAHAVISHAITGLRQGMDFADALHLQSALHAGCSEGFASFDTRFIKRASKQWPGTAIHAP